MTSPQAKPFQAVPSAPAPLDPQQWVERHGDVLYRYALGRLRNPQLAEEAVQEALLAALQSKDRFVGRSSERTWLVGILKHKILDHFRKASRERPVGTIASWPEEMGDAFTESGHWNPGSSAVPMDWGDNPERELERKEFWEALSRCVDRLPERLGQVFSLRVMDELDSRQICEAMNITPSNLWVMLHRARMQLRNCLERSWFEQRRALQGESGARDASEDQACPH